VSKLRQDVRIGEKAVEDELADPDDVGQVWDRKDLSEDGFQSNVKPENVNWKLCLKRQFFVW
jgi:hypothetical protein